MMTHPITSDKVTMNTKLAKNVEIFQFKRIEFENDQQQQPKIK